MDRDDVIVFWCEIEDKVVRGKLIYGLFLELEFDEWY